MVEIKVGDRLELYNRIYDVIRVEDDICVLVTKNRLGELNIAYKTLVEQIQNHQIKVVLE